MKRLLLLAGLAYLLILAGLASKAGGMLALSIPVVLFLAAALVFGPQRVRLQVSRALSADRVSANTPVVVQVSLTNRGSRLEQVSIVDLVPQGLELLDGDPTLVTSLSPGQETSLEYVVAAGRGRYDFGDVQATACDHLGLFRRRASVSAPAQLSVLPSRLRLRRLAIRPLRTRGSAGPVPAKRGGSGIDFFGVREYQVGDPRRWINWRTSARHLHNLFTNEFQQERIADVGLILDARRRTDVQFGGDSLFEHAVQATAALAEAFLIDGNRVGLLVYGHFLDWTFPGYGKVQRELILRALARAQTGESQVFDSFDYLPSRYFPAQSQLVLISPLCSDDVPMLVRLRARGYQLMVIRPDPVTFEVKATEPEPAIELAARIIRVERALVLRRLQQAGIQVVDWQVEKPFDHVVHASLGRMPHWFRTLGVEPQS